MSEIAARRIYYLVAVAIVAIVLISVVATSRPVTFQSPNTPAQVKTLQVTGEGTVSATPDEALLLLAVQTQSTSANQASSDNAAIMSSVIGALANIGIGKSAIQTVSYSLTPIYQPKQDHHASQQDEGCHCADYQDARNFWRRFERWRGGRRGD